MTYEKFKALSTALEEEDGWSTCIELREVNDKLWKGQWGAMAVSYTHLTLPTICSV